MYFTPELVPLVDRSLYRMHVSFLLPLILERVRTPGQRIDARVEVTAHINGRSEPVICPFEFPDCRANTQYTFELNEPLRAAGIPEDAEGFCLFRTSVTSAGALPSVLKVVGFWIAFESDAGYVVLPSNVEYASARLNYDKAADAILLDYFGRVDISDTVSASVAIMNPFPGDIPAEIFFLDDGREIGSVRVSVPAREICWVDLRAELATLGHASFCGSLKLVSPHRVVWFAFSSDRKRGRFYAADHAIPWINRQL